MGAMEVTNFWIKVKHKDRKNGWEFRRKTVFGPAERI
jgi:hypothetical protein